MARSSRSGRAPGGDFALARYNPNGSLDPSFSGDGKQTTDLGGLDEANAVALQGDGKIVAVGGAGTPSASSTGQGADDVFALARYNPNGSLDTSFSGDGKQTTDFGGFNDKATAVALQGDGKIVVVGSGGSDVTGNSDLAVARYNPNGSLDTSFSGDGKQTTDFGDLDEAAGVAIQPDGKIVAVGFANTAFDFENFVLARYNADGSLDTSFSGDGTQTTDFGADDRATGVALQGDGKIVAVGRGGTGDDFALARYNPDGSLDASFSGDGMQTTDFGGDDRANGVALQGDGKIVAVGRGGTGDDFALARYNPNGSLDTSFSGDGRQTTNVVASTGRTAWRSKAMARSSRWAPPPATSPSSATTSTARSTRASPATAGRRPTSGGSDGANEVALQDDGGIVAAGVGRAPDGTPDFALARYPRGLDREFRMGAVVEPPTLACDSEGVCRWLLLATTCVEGGEGRPPCSVLLPSSFGLVFPIPFP